MAWPKSGVTLALGGGGTRGFAHVGVFEVLQEAGIKVNGLAGTSAGSVAGAGFAIGRSVREMRSRVIAFSRSDLANDSRIRAMVEQAADESDSGLSDRLGRLFCKGRVVGSLVLSEGVLDLDYFRSMVEFFIPDVSFESLSTPFVAVAADILSGEAVVFKSGPLRPALLASSAVPGAAPVVLHQGRYLVDGGVVSLVPVEQAKENFGGRVVAVHVGPETKHQVPPSQGLETYFRATEVEGAMLCQIQLRYADLVIRPQVGEFHWADFSQAEAIMEAGREAAKAKLSELKQLACRRFWVFGGSGRR